MPTSTDVACIGAGKTVKVTGGVGAVTGVVQGAGTLEVQASSLEIASSLEPSVISSFTQTGGTLTGAGSLQVSSSLSWTRGTMAGSGQTVVKAGAVAILSSGENKFLATRTLTNDGTMTLSEGQFWMSSGADLDNVGTVIANSEYGIPVGSGEASIVNAGTFEKASGAGTTEIEPSFENSGTINASVGELRFNKSLTLSSGKLEGKLYFGGSTTTANIKGEAASVTVPLGRTFTVSSGDTTTIGTFKLNGGIVSGAGTLAIANTLTWSGGEMAGTGTTLLEESAIGEWADTGSYFLTGSRTFVNEGTVTSSAGQLWMYEYAKLENFGILKENGPERLAITYPTTYPYKTLPMIYNYGLFEKAEGSGKTEIGPGFDNFGQVTEAKETTLYFDNSYVVATEAEWAKKIIRLLLVANPRSVAKM